VRNPLSSAIAALSFVVVANREQPTPEQKQEIDDDLAIVDASLQFVGIVVLVVVFHSSLLSAH